MKQCPKCRTNYADDTLRFCLEDGTPLVASVEQETVIRPGERESYVTEQLPSNITQGNDPMRVNIPQSDRSTRPINVHKVESDFPWTKFVVAGLAIGLIVVVAVPCDNALDDCQPDAGPFIIDGRRKETP